MARPRPLSWLGGIRALPLKTIIGIYTALLVATQGIMALLEAPTWIRVAAVVVIAVLAIAQTIDDLRTRNKSQREDEQKEQQELENAEAARQRAIADSVRIWPAPSVGEADPYQLGVTRSTTADVYRKDGELIAPYVDRDLDTRADERLLESGLLLLIGVPASGVTRTAYQLACRATPDARILAPLSPRGLTTAVDNGILDLFAPRTQLLLWLDRIDKFSEDGLNVAMLRRLRQQSPGLRVVATIPSGYRYLSWETDNRDVAHEFGDPLIVERLPVSEAELKRAEARYPGLDFNDGIAATFTAAGSLLRRMHAGNSKCDYAACTGDCALTRAFVAAAMEWAGTGTPRPQPVDSLSALVQHRMSQSQPPDPKHLASALSWAVSPVDEGAGLLELVTSEEGAQTVTAYPEVAAIHLENSPGPAEPVWAAALGDAAAANDSDAIGQIGFRAHIGDNANIAERAWERITSVHEPGMQWLLRASRWSRRRRDATATRLVAEKRFFTLALAGGVSEFDPTYGLVRARLELGHAFYDREQPRQALDLFEQAYATVKPVAGADPSLLAESLECMAAARNRIGETDTARENFDSALAIYERLFGKESAQVERTLSNLGHVWLDLEKPDIARELSERGLDLARRLYGDKSEEVESAITSLADVWLVLDEPDIARGLLEEALPIARRSYGPGHHKVAAVLDGLGRVWLGLHKPDTARTFLERAHRILKQELGDKSEPLACTLDNLGATWSQLDNPKVACGLYEQALEIHEREYGPDHPKLKASLRGAASAQERLGPPAKARELYERVLGIEEAQFGRDDPNIARTLNDLARTWLAEGQAAEARNLLARGLNVLHKAFPRGQEFIDELATNMGVADPDAIVFGNGQVLYRTEKPGDDPDKDGPQR